jgi:excisionase family DNA binding protein
MRGWLKIKPAAEYVSVSPRTLRKWLRRGLKHSRVGGSILLKVDDLDAYVERFSESSDQVDEMVNKVVKAVLHG